MSYSFLTPPLPLVTLVFAAMGIWVGRYKSVLWVG